MPWVVCAECTTRYESEALGFCPRCGSTARSGQATPTHVPMRRDPARMRLQLGGVLLLIMGSLFLLAVGLTVLNPEVREAQSFALLSGPQGSPDRETGRILVLASEAGRPLAGLNVTVASGNSTLANGTTDASGRFELQLRGYVAVNVTLSMPGKAWTRHVLAPSGATVDVPIDIARDPETSARVVGPHSLILASTIAGLVLAALLALGGLAAILVRWRGLALAGPLPLVVFLALLVVPFGVAGLLFFALVAAPYALVVSGRSAFPRR